MASGNFLPLRLFCRAALVCVRAAGAEPAAAWRVHRARDVALQHDSFRLSAGLRVRDGDCGDQALRIRMDTVECQFIAVRQFHHLTEVHNADSVGNVLYN